MDEKIPLEDIDPPAEKPIYGLLNCLCGHAHDSSSNTLTWEYYRLSITEHSSKRVMRCKTCKEVLLMSCSIG